MTYSDSLELFFGASSRSKKPTSNPETYSDKFRQTDKEVERMIMRKLLAIGILLLLLAACGRGRNAEQPTATAPVADTSAATTAPATDPTAAPTAPEAAQADAPSDSASSADAQE